MTKPTMDLTAATLTAKGNYDINGWDAQLNAQVPNYQVVSGSRAKHHQKEGISSINDANAIDNHRQWAKNTSHPTVVFKQYVKTADGKGYVEAKGQSMNWGGREFTASGDGYVRLIDEKVMEERVRPYIERAEYIGGILKKCLYSDEIFAAYLDMDVKMLVEWLKAGSGLFLAQFPNLTDLNKYSGIPDEIAGYTGDSPFYTNGVLKARKVLEFFCPATLGSDEQSTKHEMNTGIEK